jgi:hypothetical protein
MSHGLPGASHGLPATNKELVGELVRHFEIALSYTVTWKNGSPPGIG